MCYTLVRRYRDSQVMLCPPYAPFLPLLHLVDRPPHTSIINTYTKSLPRRESYPTDHTYNTFSQYAYHLPWARVCRLLARCCIGPVMCTCYSGLTQSEQGARTVRIAYKRTTLSPNLCSSKETCKNKQDTMERKRTHVINKQPS